MNSHFPPLRSRRDFLFHAGGGLGGIALNWLLAHEVARRRESRPKNPLAAKKPHFEPKAKRVIFLFMVGGPSQMDLFDPKPALAKWPGKPLPEIDRPAEEPVHQGRRGHPRQHAQVRRSTARAASRCPT